MYKKIGLIGGLSPESTCSYYTYITRKYIELYGDCSYPEIVIYSVNLENYHIWRDQNRWDLVTDDLIKAGKALERAGAEIGLIATNTMHKVFNEVQKELNIELISIIDSTIKDIDNRGLKTVGLLGTRFTMSDGFYSDKLSNSDIRVITPNTEQQSYVHKIIEDELVKGILSPESKEEYIKIINEMIEKGAEGIILGCTEIPLLIKQSDLSVTVFDTATLHAEDILNVAVGRKDIL